MATKLYGRGQVFADNNLLGEATSINLSISSGAAPVATLSKGFSGVFVGNASTSISVDSMIPDASIEFDPTYYMSNTIELELTVFVGGKQVTCAGYITDCSVSSGSDSAATISFTFIGGESKFE